MNEIFDPLPDLPAELQSSSDRACAIVGAGILDALLEQLLKRSFVIGSSDRLFDSFGPLDTFAGKIDLARALGLIPATEADDLHRIRKIRNEFAHSLEHMAFASAPVRDHVAAFNFRSSRFIAREFSVRQEFSDCVAMLSGLLKGRIDKAKPPVEPHDIAKVLADGGKSSN